MASAEKYPSRLHLQWLYNRLLLHSKYDLWFNNTIGKKMKLIEILNEIRERDSLNDRMTVYVKREWTPNSEAILTQQPEDGSTVPIDGHDYFLEAFIIKDWLDDLDSPEVTSEQCNRIIQYAINDA